MYDQQVQGGNAFLKYKNDKLVTDDMGTETTDILWRLTNLWRNSVFPHRNLCLI